MERYFPSRLYTKLLSQAFSRLANREMHVFLDPLLPGWNRGFRSTSVRNSLSSRIVLSASLILRIRSSCSWAQHLLCAFLFCNITRHSRTIAATPPLPSGACLCDTPSPSRLFPYRVHYRQETARLSGSAHFLQIDLRHWLLNSVAEISFPHGNPSISTTL